MKRIAIIIRGKHSEDHAPKLLEQHADMVLSDGSPIGYFGTGGMSPSIGMMMRGIVYNFEEFKQTRPYYVDAQKAKDLRVVSTICYFPVSEIQAKKFDSFWKTIDIKADGKSSDYSFSLLGNNCSTNANKALVNAKILNSGVPGIDSPQNLFLQLKAKFGTTFSCQSGFLGFRKDGLRFKLEVLR